MECDAQHSVVEALIIERYLTLQGHGRRLLANLGGDVPRLVVGMVRCPTDHVLVNAYAFDISNTFDVSQI